MFDVPGVTTDQIVAGLGLTIALAVGAHVLARELRLPSLIVLLPAGFVAGAVTPVVDPDQLLGPLFQPIVSLAVAVVLFESGLGLDLAGLRGHTRRVVRRLILIGIPTTLAFAAAAAGLLLGVSEQAALMIGAILVVSGPTVVGPLLGAAGLNQRLRTVLGWEGSLIDPVGAIVGTLVFHAIVSGSGQHVLLFQVGQFLASLGVGLAGGVLGTLVLWLLLRRLSLAEVLGTETVLGTVVAVAALCDVVRDDTGLIAAIVIGLALANLPGFDLPARRPFFETVIQLTIGVLFISISASVTPASVGAVLLPALGLVAVLVLVCRPLVALLSTLGTDLGRGERAFIGWMFPRGIVAAATASAFSVTLVANGVRGASAILPVTFVVIVATVTIYGLTAAPAARLLGVTGASRSRPLIVGGSEWVIDLARALQAAGLSVLMWAASPRQRRRIEQAGLELASGRLLPAVTDRRAQIEGVSIVLLLTAEDEFNALAAVTLPDAFDGDVYRVAHPHQDLEIVAPFTRESVLFGQPLTGIEISQRHRRGARIVTRPASAAQSDDCLLFVVRAGGLLAPVTAAGRPPAREGDRLVLLEPPVPAPPPH